MAKVLFEGQREGEKVELVFRRHFLTAWKGVAWLITLTLLGVLTLVIWKGQGVMLWVCLGLVAVGLIGSAYAWMLWYFSVYILTDQRLRQVRQKGLFKKSVVDLGMDKIQSVSYGVPGLFGGVFGYGTVLLNTAAGDLTISMVKDPAEIGNKLQDLQGKAGK